ncbi:MAG: FMN-binding protein, partial [Oscillospiraceae bacterium]|nr:FMN-binding protein [Oscillospiraceae bacterium]
MKPSISRRDFLKHLAVGAAAGLVTSTGLVSVSADNDAIYTPGTYSATANGMGKVTVTMTFDETSITDVQIDASGETPGIGVEAAAILKDAINEGQTAEIDGISGATITSLAVKTAAANCIAQAMKVPLAEEVADAAGAPEAESADTGKWYDEEYFKKPDPIPAEEISEVVDYEVVVVGAGNSGCPCAISCADLGAKIAWVERSPGVVTWAGEMGAYNSDVMKNKYGIEYSEEELQEIINNICATGSYDVDQRLISLWVHESGRTMNWYAKMMKAKGLDMFIETDLKDTRFMT